jgi:hypothetical protein
MRTQREIHKNTAHTFLNQRHQRIPHTAVGKQSMDQQHTWPATTALILQ